MLSFFSSNVSIITIIVATLIAILSILSQKSNTEYKKYLKFIIFFSIFLLAFQIFEAFENNKKENVIKSLAEQTNNTVIKNDSDLDSILNKNSTIVEISNSIVKQNVLNKEILKKLNLKLNEESRINFEKKKTYILSSLRKYTEAKSLFNMRKFSFASNYSMGISFPELLNINNKIFKEYENDINYIIDKILQCDFVTDHEFFYETWSNIRNTIHIEMRWMYLEKGNYPINDSLKIEINDKNKAIYLSKLEIKIDSVLNDLAWKEQDILINNGIKLEPGLMFITR